MSLERIYSRTDLACESGVGAGRPVSGVGYREYVRHGISAAELTVNDEAGAAVTGRSKGRYVTLSFGEPTLMSNEEEKSLTEAVAAELISFVEAALGRIAPSTAVLVAGLGNRHITADSLGPSVAEGVSVTRHLVKKFRSEALSRCSVISAIAPGVMGQTGIEAAELICGAAKRIMPDVIIAVDALAARSVSRLCTTVQISDSGISPGSGIGNKRKAISHSTVGVPVIALGVPTVVDSSSLVYDALAEAGIDSISDNLTAVLENGRSFFVSPKDSDAAIRRLAEIISNAINSVFSSEIL